MSWIYYSGRMSRSNLFDALPTDLSQEHFETLVHNNRVRIERIVSHGQQSPADFWYAQSSAEWIVVLQGQAGLQFEGETDVLEMGPGDYVNIPAHKKHRVAWTLADATTIWLAVHY